MSTDIKRELEKLYSSWSDCQKCGLHQFRRQVVCGDGDLHPHIMFVGEGPGKAEDLLGRPFVGPSGRVLRRAISDAVDLAGVTKRQRFYFTNVVACRPTEARAYPNRAPTKQEAWSCMQRLVNIEQILQPGLVVLLGVVPARLAGHLFPSAGKLPHPAAILRSGGVESGSYPGYVRDMSEHIQQANRLMLRRTVVDGT